MRKAGLHLTVACEQCGRDYRQSRSDQRFCTPHCAQVSWHQRQEKPSIPCQVCGETLPKGRKSYCSDECSSLAQSKRRKVIDGPGKGHSRNRVYVARQKCEVCGTEFYAPPGRLIKQQGRFCSVGCRGLFMSQHPEHFPQTRSRRGIGGRRKDLGNRYFRSTWEANYARYLNFLVEHGEIVRWEYEVDVFEFPIKRGSRSYLPDFKVWTTDTEFEYHEVKGYMDARSATKLKRMRLYYPDVKLVVIDRFVYRTLEQTVSVMLRGWERTAH